MKPFSKTFPRQWSLRSLAFRGSDTSSQEMCWLRCVSIIITMRFVHDVMRLCGWRLMPSTVYLSWLRITNNVKWTVKGAAFVLDNPTMTQLMTCELVIVLSSVCFVFTKWNKAMRIRPSIRLNFWKSYLCEYYLLLIMKVKGHWPDFTLSVLVSPPKQPSCPVRFGFPESAEWR